MENTIINLNLQNEYRKVLQGLPLDNVVLTYAYRAYETMCLQDAKTENNWFANWDCTKPNEAALQNTREFIVTVYQTVIAPFLSGEDEDDTGDINLESATIHFSGTVEELKKQILGAFHFSLGFSVEQNFQETYSRLGLTVPRSSFDTQMLERQCYISEYFPGGLAVFIYPALESSNVVEAERGGRTMP